ncbi:GyrI-like domain-containing protein [Geosporobacter ferrireducens]|uniref:GyrI-like small molecule binding domain-containing protein n=1 Tax=Geosporobacter ferrireducens TaxID=1424294 RepID=A0A1D8GKY3_9FIRM|nr:GyrI-like domain-containing protein [Geosporobacter ferrireducens]AOT71551.1 hypothetical protein Gferi_19645 [Geosporobacter ferrireducens]MTI57863.1 hypothetical protein [Geosporobacter ferrireducens]
MERKVDYKKTYKEFYLPPQKPVMTNIPEMKFFMIDGKGDPNGEAFGEVVQALYSLAYGVKMMPKSGVTPGGYYEYTVFPLEGVWNMDSGAKDFSLLDKDKFIYTVMIRQPEFVTDQLAIEMIEKTKKKKPNPVLDNVCFGSIEEALCVQMMHVGSYDEEPVSFAKMEEFCIENGYKRIGHAHREIYLSDPRKTEVSKLKTVLRFRVEKIK